MLVLSLRWAFLFLGSMTLFAADIPAGHNSILLISNCATSLWEVKQLGSVT